MIKFLLLCYKEEIFVLFYIKNLKKFIIIVFINMWLEKKVVVKNSLKKIELRKLNRLGLKFDEKMKKY